MFREEAGYSVRASALRFDMINGHVQTDGESSGALSGGRYEYE